MRRLKPLKKRSFSPVTRLDECPGLPFSADGEGTWRDFEPFGAIQVKEW